MLKTHCIDETASFKNTGGSLLLFLSHFMYFYSEPSGTGLTYSFHLFYLHKGRKKKQNVPGVSFEEWKGKCNQGNEM